MFLFLLLQEVSQRGSFCDLCQSVLPMFTCKNFILSGHIFRSLTHFEFIFVHGVRNCCNFILLHVAIQFSQHRLLKRLSFLLCIFLPPLSNITYPQVHGFISGLPILFHCFIFLFFSFLFFFVPAPYCLDYCSFVLICRAGIEMQTQTGLWTQQEKGRVGQIETAALKHT